MEQKTGDRNTATTEVDQIEHLSKIKVSSGILTNIWRQHCPLLCPIATPINIGE